MTRTTPTSPPDPVPVLAGLRDFQQRTVDYVFDRFYGDVDPVRRFLVADEVGLGKTMVAKGVIARAVETLWERLDEIRRIDVVYICSNLAIARQNANRLRIAGDHGFAEPTRITLLPRTIRELDSRPLNFVSLTPTTSFDPRSSLGIAEERALLHMLLEEPWGLSGARPLNLLAGGSGRESFEYRLDCLYEEDDIDETLARTFQRRLATEAGEELRSRWDELLPSFARAGSRSNRPEEVRRDQARLIGDLRRLLAETCVQALEPDLIILDEFQRFRELLHADPVTGSRSEAGELADVLFRSPEAKVLLLSATPYKAYTQGGEVEEDHYRDFLETARFLFGEDGGTADLVRLLESMRGELLALGPGSAVRLAALKAEVERLLRRVMCRTERLGATPDREGMLVEEALHALAPETADLEAYVAAAEVSENLDAGDPLEYWKSAPYLLNMMDDYQLKRRLREGLDAEADPEERAALEVSLRQASGSFLPFDDLGGYRGVDPQNARLRSLAGQTVERGWWRLLWMAPTLPYHELGGPFADPEARWMTKRLIFSAWTVAPKAIATLLSHEAERLAALSAGIASNDSDARGKRSGLLDFRRSQGRLSGMPVFGLLYPSFTLAEAVDVRSLGGESRTSIEDAVARAMDALRPSLGQLVGTRAEADGPPDQRWYWAAPILLDVRRDGGAALDWLRDGQTAAEWADADEPDDGSAWADHFAQALEVAEDAPPLGSPPADLLQVLARLAIAGPGVAPLRALSLVAGDEGAERDPEVRIAAARVAWSLRTLFNTPEATDVLRGLRSSRSPYWDRVLDYCLHGCLQAVLDEFAHVLRDTQGLSSGAGPGEIAREIGEVMAEAVGVRTSPTTVDELRVDGASVELVPNRLRMRFAMRFGDQKGEGEEQVQRAEHVRGAFNGPFWPFVLASTSIGQEGLDFHPYCHAVVHWNLPSNPVDLEQREGRVHRYKGHAVRRNLAERHGPETLAERPSDPWGRLFVAGVEARDPGSSDLEPYWLAPGSARIERHVLAPALSRDRVRLADLKRSLALYRMVFGQPRQGDLLDYLADRVPEEEIDELRDVLRVSLEPPARSG
ncbi:MAG: helicase [Actinobacteria bacterium]|nr:helicase [Actinomycetota bacterium]